MKPCENCRKTERNLAKAYGKIEELLNAARDLALAESYANEVATTIKERADTLRSVRHEVAEWLVKQR